MLVFGRWISLNALFIGILCGGCSSEDGRLETCPVEGRVMVNGQPADGCTVAFVPLDPDLRGVIMPGGKTDEEGRFQLTTYETDDGAPAGEYGVTLRWEAKQWPGREAQMRVDPVAPIGPDLLQGRFSSPEKSGLTATVDEGENAIAPFELKDVRLLKGAE